MNLDDLKKRIRSLVDDDDATYTTDSFLLPKINQKYEEMYQQIKLAGAEFDQQIIELPSIPAGTTNLNSYQDAGQPLELLLDPTMLEWKLPGMDPINYCRAYGPLDKVRDVIPGPYIDSWGFIGQNIYLAPPNTAIDVRLTGGFAFSPLKGDADKIMAGVQIGHAIVYGVASLIGVVRGNPQWEKSYGDKADDAIETLALLLTRQQQSKIRRVARMTRNWRTQQFRAPEFVVSLGSNNPSPSPGDNNLTVIAYFANANLPNTYSNLFAEGYAGSTGITLQLYDSTTAVPQQVTVKKMDNNVNPVTVTVSGVDTIDGASSYVLTNFNQFVSMISNGAGLWSIVSNN